MDSANELYFPFAVASEESAASLTDVDLGRFLHLVGWADLVLGHEIWVLGHHLLLELAERVLTIVIGLLRDLILLNLADIVDLLQERVRVVVDHMDSVVILSAVVLQALFVVAHLHKEGARGIFELKCHILSLGSETSLKLLLDLEEWQTPVKSDFLKIHVSEHGVGHIEL